MLEEAIQKIISEEANAAGIGGQDLLTGKNKLTTQARQKAMWRAREELQISCHKIAPIFARTPDCILKSHRKVAARIYHKCQ